MEAEQLKLPWPIARETRSDGVLGIPVRCRTCWHREGRACFNSKIRDIPTEWHSFTTREGHTDGYNRRLGNDLSDDDLIRECVAHRAHLNGRSVLPSLFAGVNPIQNEFGGGAP